MKIVVTSIWYMTVIWKMIIINARRYEALVYEHPLLWIENLLLKVSIFA